MFVEIRIWASFPNPAFCARKVPYFSIGERPKKVLSEKSNWGKGILGFGNTAELHESMSHHKDNLRIRNYKSACHLFMDK